MKARAQAEYHPVKTIVMKKPKLEASIGALAPAASLFQGPLNTTEAQEEFDILKMKLEQFADSVYEVDDILLSSNKDLKQLAKQALSNNYSKINKKDREQLIKQENYIIDTVSEQTLLDTIFMNPKITYKYDDKNTGLKPKTTISPAYNMMFLRDQQITTDKGIIMGNMNSGQRRFETTIMEAAFDILGVDNVYKLRNGDKLEGGDFLPAGKRAFIGTGLRTERGAIDDILEQGLVGYDQIIVVEDKLKSQDEMHLDTYFNVIAEDKVALLDTRIESKDPKKVLTAHIYSKNDDGTYTNGIEMALDKYLVTEGYKVIPITEQEQRAYGMNFLTLESNKVIGVDIAAKESMAKDIRKAANIYSFELDQDVWGVDFKKLGQNYVQKMIDNDVAYIPSKFNMLNMMYGSVHCMTQVIERHASLPDAGLEMEFEKAYVDVKGPSPN